MIAGEEKLLGLEMITGEEKAAWAGEEKRGGKSCSGWLR